MRACHGADTEVTGQLAGVGFLFPSWVPGIGLGL